jgi:hypothetical protein
MGKGAAAGQVTRGAATIGRSEQETAFVAFVPFVSFVATKTLRR